MEDSTSAKPLVYQELRLPQELQEIVDEEFHIVWPEHLSRYQASIEAILSTSTTPINSKHLEAFPSLKVVSNIGVGYDHINVKDCAACNVRVGNTADTLNDTTADMAFALLLASARRVVEGNIVSKDKVTSVFRSDVFGFSVSGKTIGIIGMGRIGREIAKRARGFAMTVIYHNRNQLPEATEAAACASYVSKDQLLCTSDFVVVSIPGNQENENYIGREEFAKMKRTVVFVNIGRGSVVDQDAFVTALSTGQIGAAGIDVTSPEPLPRDHPLLSLPNVTITPHTGSATLVTRQRMVKMAIDNINAGLNGKPLVKEVTC